MKFFTPNACLRFGRAGEFERVSKRYWQHLGGLEGRVPPRVLKLGSPGFLRDALVCRVELDRQQKELLVVLRTGDLIQGYFTTEIRYSDIDFTFESQQALEQIARTTTSHRVFEVCLSYEEIDLARDGKFIHRVIFGGYPTQDGTSDALWLEVICRGVRWTQRKCKSRRLPAVADRFLEI